MTPAGISSAMNDVGQRLIDQKAQQHIQQPFTEGEGYVKNEQTLEQAVRSGQDGLISPDDVFHAAKQAGVEGIDHEVIHGKGDDRHCNRTGERGGNGALSGVVLQIKKARCKRKRQGT